MIRAARSIFRLAVVLVLLTMPAAAPMPGGHDAAETAAPISSVGQVKLRKLHLVRPDLIPYPLSYEIVC